MSSDDVDGNKILAEALVAQVKISNKYNELVSKFNKVMQNDTTGFFIGYVLLQISLYFRVLSMCLALLVSLWLS